MKKIGAGAFGEIYSGKNIITNEMVAIKVERVDSKKQVLKLEVAVLKKIQACPFVCRFITCGRFNEYNYMIMELLGENLSELRRRQEDGKFSIHTTVKLGVQIIKSLEATHDLGYIHRDVKPSNFAMGLNGVKRQITFIIDFGLARRYVLASGEVRPARDSTGFRGTARYASINSHLSKDLGRRDDLWSVLYMLIEFALGQLPWRKLKDKDQIGEMKVKYNIPDLVKDLPPQFLLFMKHLKSLNYLDRPDYTYLQNILLEMYHTAGGDDHTPFDWEIGPRHNTISLTGGPPNIASNPQNMNKRSPSDEAIEAAKARDSMQRVNGTGLSSENLQNGENPPLEHKSTASSASAVSTDADQEQTGSWHQNSPKISHAESHSKLVGKRQSDEVIDPPKETTPVVSVPKIKVPLENTIPEQERRQEHHKSCGCLLM